MREPAPRAVLPFRVHFEDETITPVDIAACDPDEARKRVALTHPGKPVNKVKIVREKI
ncbi:hypothetical protein C8J36_103550 [Rhizobium sp. PP-F2F-G48]|uniref:hypothetical protein n=1 Tax=Rhizobium sp. PP-F2F-G48 TaxID=2135651 RepID=UPI0010D09FE2|nr:hypothetical protein [Rhizobium sp. PP-F2F-G48]TCM56180.1 hypothetical protein C8J36_103550 [Rhizobium sp. PP-F2F-G48]